MHTSTITHLRLASLLLMLLVAVIVRDLFPVLFGLGLALAVSLGDLGLAQILGLYIHIYIHRWQKSKRQQFILKLCAAPVYANGTFPYLMCLLP